MRTLVDLPEDDIRWLDQRAAEGRRSRAALVREAVAAYRAGATRDWIAGGAGYWQDRGDLSDGVAYQRAIREDRHEP